MDQQIETVKFRPDVLMQGLARHDHPYSSTAWSLAKAFSRQGRVFYIDNPFTFSDFFKKQKRHQIRKRYTRFFKRKQDLIHLKDENITVIVSPLMIPVNWLPAGKLYSLLNGFNNWRHKRNVNRVLKKYRVKDYIYINSFNPFYGAGGDFNPAPAVYIYQTVDDISQSRYVAKHGTRLEKEAMQHADVCATTSISLQKKAATVAKKAICIPNAADVHLFKLVGEKDFEKPEEIKNETRPIICYTGNIDHRLDYRLLIEVAQFHKDKLILMVGPVTGDFCKESGFPDLPNVLFTGRKELEELPAYLQYSSCAIIPFKCNELTASIYPLKINEYLAAGKAVVATPFSEDIRTFKNFVALRPDGKSFAEAIAACLVSDSAEVRQKRKKIALQNNWKSRASDFYALALGKEQKGLEKENRSEYEKAIG